MILFPDVQRVQAGVQPHVQPETQAGRAMCSVCRQIDAYAGARAMAGQPIVRAASRVYGNTLHTLHTLHIAVTARVCGQRLPAHVPAHAAHARSRTRAPLFSPFCRRKGKGGIG